MAGYQPSRLDRWVMRLAAERLRPGSAELVTALALSRFMDTETLECFPGRDVLAELGDCDPSKIKRGAGGLVRRGLLLVKTGRGRGNLTVYQGLLPEDQKGAAHTEPSAPFSGDGDDAEKGAASARGGAPVSPADEPAEKGAKRGRQRARADSGRVEQPPFSFARAAENGGVADGSATAPRPARDLANVLEAESPAEVVRAAGRWWRGRRGKAGDLKPGLAQLRGSLLSGELDVTALKIACRAFDQLARERADGGCGRPLAYRFDDFAEAALQLRPYAQAYEEAGRFIRAGHRGTPPTASAPNFAAVGAELLCADLFAVLLKSPELMRELCGVVDAVGGDDDAGVFLEVEPGGARVSGLHR